MFKEGDEIFTWQLEWADGTFCNSYAIRGMYQWVYGLNPCTAYTGQAEKSSRGPFMFEHVFQQKLQIDDFTSR